MSCQLWGMFQGISGCSLDTWTAPVQRQHCSGTAAHIATCPLPVEQNRLAFGYFLQAVDDPDLIDARNDLEYCHEHRTPGRTVGRPQETVLSRFGYGIAGGSSLQTARPQQQFLTPPQAYRFSKPVAWRLEDSGFRHCDAKQKIKGLRAQPAGSESSGETPYPKSMGT